MIGIILGGMGISTILIAITIIGIKLENREAERFRNEETWEW